MKKVYSIVSRLLAALFGGVLFAIITPVSYFLIFKSVPSESLVTGITVLVAIGFAIGAVLGALFPKVFGFIFDVFTDGDLTNSK